DVGEAEDVRELFLAPERLGWPALKGVVHAAGVLDDGVLGSQSWERFERVMRPKVVGARNLSESARGLDFLILFSSAASLLGSPGQANYAAANAYLDGLAQAGRARGERWLSINWGAWAEVGMAAATDERVRRVAGRGMQGMSPAPALEVMWRLAGEARSGQAAVMAVDWGQLLDLHPLLSKVPLFYEVTKNARRLPKGAGEALKKQLDAAAPGERYGLLRAHVQREVEKVLRFTAADNLDPQAVFSELGVDSLTAVEIKTALEVSVGHPLPITLLFDHPSVEGVTRHLAQDVFSIDLPETPAAQSQRDEEMDRALSEVEGLSEEEMDKILLGLAGEHYKRLEG
ncbi:MAG TPA: beta-ketoacyl reductase, partial [Pyrinomonadaceae bacterium]